MLLRIVFAVAVLLCAAVDAAAQNATPLADYVGASACKACHTAQYDAWEKTKHAHAITRLSTAERDASQPCVGCHITGATLAADGINANVQCEACHGAGRAHLDAAAAGAAKPGSIVKKPSEGTCVKCHSDKSPHFKFFSYPALVPLVHQVGK